MRQAAKTTAITNLLISIMTNPVCWIRRPIHTTTILYYSAHCLLTQPALSNNISMFILRLVMMSKFNIPVEYFEPEYIARVTGT